MITASRITPTPPAQRLLTVADLGVLPSTVTIYRRRRRPKVLKETETLTVEDIIPGFQVLVATLFEV